MFEPYNILIWMSLLVCLSYLYDRASKKYKIPSVLLLIFTGIFFNQFFHYIGYDIDKYEEEIDVLLHFLGIIGLIMIVLEASIDLKISKEKMPVISKSFFLAITILIISSLLIALVLNLYLQEKLYNSFIYAIPLSVVSSAILLPSVKRIAASKKEFLIYEATFSDIIGIMFFNFVVLDGFSGYGSIKEFFIIIFTVVLSFGLTFLLVFLISKIKTRVKFFLILSILMLLYALGKQLNLSSLLIILVFGIVLNNTRLFFKWKGKDLIDIHSIMNMRIDFKVLTAETTFLIRTFFFVVFGLSLEIYELFNSKVIIVGSFIVLILYLVRYVNFRIFLKTEIFPEIFLSPRGLITILLFYSIPVNYQIKSFSVGILFFVILATGIIMMFALIKTPVKTEEMTIIDYGLAPVKEIDEEVFGDSSNIDEKTDIN